jgi:RHS repeat-associated protein
MTAFGESADPNAMYTGKPYIGELGYAFLFRNYRSDYGKWQTTDPLGYPDGWNNLAYCNNGVTIKIDYLGGNEVVIVVYKENTPYGPHTWAEVHNNGQMDTAVGFYPNSNGTWGTPGQVLVGNNESHTSDATKIVESVYAVTEIDASTVIGSAYGYFHNKQIYNPLNPLTSNVCWDFTNYIEKLLDSIGYTDISDNYFPANLNPNENTYNTIADYINRKLE